MRVPDRGKIDVASGYSEDLALIHDAGFGGLARAAAATLIRTLRARRIHAGLAVELGCGSGIGAQELVRAGYRVLGVDISPAMLRIARRRAPKAKFVTGSLLRVDLPSCSAVAAIGEGINYAFDPAAQRSALSSLFRRVFAALQPGGVFLFDFAEPGQIRAGTTRASHASGDGWAVLVDATEDKERRRLTRRILSFRRSGRLFRRTEETHVIRLYPAAELLAELRRIGFRARVLRRYGDLRLRPAHAGILACKPAS